METKAEQSSTRWVLERESELRLEIAESETVTLRLEKGTAEIFGTELAGERSYVFTNRKIAIFSWYGCTLSTTGSCTAAYVSNETPMVQYANVHGRLEARRDEAVAKNTKGPRVLITGPTDAGKSTLARILLTYAIRRGRRPTFVDLDVGQGELSIPGVISATPLDISCLTIEDGFSSTVPLSFFFGHNSPGENLTLFNTLVGSLAASVNRRLEGDPEGAAAGVVINTCGWVDGGGFQSICHAIDAFRADVVIVLGHDRLYAQLTQKFAGGSAAGRVGGPAAESKERAVAVVKLERSGGVTQRGKQERRGARKTRVREYFYGSGRDVTLGASLAPSHTHLKFDAVEIFKIGGDVELDVNMLPVGSKSTLSPLTPSPVAPSVDLLHSVLAVSFAQSSDQLLEAAAAGFVYVNNVDLEKGTLTVLAPCPGPLPGKFLLLGSLKWLET